MERRKFIRILFGAALISLVFLLGERAWNIRSARGARRDVAAERAAWNTQLEPVMTTVHEWKAKPEQACTLPPATNVPWLGYRVESPEGEPIEAPSRETPDPKRFEHAPLVVAVREHRGHPSADVLVLELPTGKALCWTEAEGVDGVAKIWSGAILDR